MNSECGFTFDEAKFDALCKDVFDSEPSVQRARFNGLVEAHKQQFGVDVEEFYSSPGRIEILGNHTDHNGGKVLCAAINFDTLACVSSRDDGIIEVKSAGYPIIRVDVNAPTFSPSELGTSTALVKGVVDYFAKHGKAVGGFSASMASNVPKGSGVSSSSSFELVIAEILNVKYNDGVLDAIFKAKASQYAENVFFGKPCGLMDQSAIALGNVNLIDFYDFENPIVEGANWSFDDLDIFVIATGGDHSNLTGDYAAIPAEMKEVAECFGKKLLCEIPRETWESEKLSVKGKVSERAYLRAEHFFEENERVERAVKAVESKDEHTFLEMVNASGLSSRHKLQNTYSPVGRNRNLENALDSVVHIDGVVASRVHGGGFAGTILVFTKKGAAEAEKAFNASFGKENVFKMSIRKHGAIRLNLEK
ncbi:MAG: galactokinase [Clostridiales bacterium]|nr:galactokinase [Clostridiales bacterium]